MQILKYQHTPDWTLYLRLDDACCITIYDNGAIQHNNVAFEDAQTRAYSWGYEPYQSDEIEDMFNKIDQLINFNSL